jgi:hypothetical protein
LLAAREEVLAVVAGLVVVVVAAAVSEIGTDYATLKRRTTLAETETVVGLRLLPHNSDSMGSSYGHNPRSYVYF